MASSQPRSRRGLRGHRATTVVAAAVVAGGVVLGTLGRGSAGVPEGAAGSADPVPRIAPSLATPPPAATDPWSQAGAAADPGEPAPQVPGASRVVVRESGSGRTHVLTPPGDDSGRTGRVVRYTVEAENGVGVPTAEFAAHVRAVLTSPRGWEVRDGVHFVNVAQGNRGDAAPVDVRIILASPDLVDRACAPLQTNGRLSCHARGKVMINAWRWVHGAVTYEGDLAGYRTYLVGHEVGHSLGHGHAPCPGKGKAAPLMLQQTLHLRGCHRWPYAVAP